ncbi:DUF3189 family protein [Desulfotomaculum copahuensis]|uniref:DUF3189 domain-containing protein n=1 Tax=Desulfotomaculum copahuensis TaxID=1838280 RepID=A0A1B7LIK2_9FIRM|nr:DUF3189 family protein [Desulfotomaculum copahuensis]OAT86409.1 hypothetical protein A6M21_02985 [Desulfotomaculum copahuensis]
MKIIYYCFGGTHSSVTAAAIHLGLLPRDRLPPAGEIAAIPWFDRRDTRQQGIPAFLGRDDRGNEVYVLGWPGRPQLIELVYAGLAGIFSLPAGSYKLVNVKEHVNLIMKAGGFLSRRLGWVTLGRPLAARGIRRAYPALRALVQAVLQELEPERHRLQ